MTKKNRRPVGIEKLYIFSCKKCNKAFFFEDRLKQHNKCHEPMLRCFVKLTREEFAKCKICNCYYPRNSKLERKHELSHIKSESLENGTHSWNNTSKPSVSQSVSYRNTLQFEDEIPVAAKNFPLRFEEEFNETRKHQKSIINSRLRFEDELSEDQKPSLNHINSRLSVRDEVDEFSEDQKLRLPRMVLRNRLCFEDEVNEIIEEQNIRTASCIVKSRLLFEDDVNEGCEELQILPLTVSARNNSNAQINKKPLSKQKKNNYKNMKSNSTSINKVKTSDTVDDVNEECEEPQILPLTVNARNNSNAQINKKPLSKQKKNNNKNMKSHSTSINKVKTSDTVDDVNEGCEEPQILPLTVSARNNSNAQINKKPLSKQKKDNYKNIKSNSTSINKIKTSDTVTLIDGYGKDIVVKKNENNKYVCPICDKKFTADHTILEHFFEHSGVKAFRCELCFKECVTLFNLKLHMLTHDSVRNFICAYCDKRFRTKTTLINHIRTHTGDKPYKCEICDKRFTQMGCMQQHIKRHKGIKNYSCQFCGKQFINKSTGTLHERTHTGEKPFKCSTCGRAFSDPSAYRRHIELHNKNNRFECDQCSKSYTTSAGLFKHKVIHTGKKPFSCNQCPYKAYAKGTIKVHVNMVHKRIKHECLICYKQYATAYNLKAHIYSYHCDIQQYECDYCKKKFIKKSGVRQHIMGVHLKLDVFECQKCKKKYSTQTGYTRHVNTVHKLIKNFECDYCGSKYTLKSTIIEHILKKHCLLKYCYKCLARFPNPEKLRIHMLNCSTNKKK